MSRTRMFDAHSAICWHSAARSLHFVGVSTSPPHLAAGVGKAWRSLAEPSNGFADLSALRFGVPMLSICRLHVFAGHLEQPVAPLPRVRLACQLQYRAYSSNLLSILDDIGCTNVLVAGIQRHALTKVPSTSPLAKWFKTENLARLRSEAGGGGRGLGAMTKLTLRYFVISGPEVKPTRFKLRRGRLRTVSELVPRLAH